jgi:hypothetical protein
MDRTGDDPRRPLQRMTWRKLGPFAAAIAVVLLMLGLGVGVSDASTTANATQNETATVTGGVLTISTANPTVAFGSLAPGASSPNTALGAILFTNTLGDGSSWTVTVASTDLVVTPGPATCTAASGCIPAFGDVTINGGGSISPTGPTLNSVPSTFSSFSDTTPGTTFSGPVNLVSGTSSEQNTYTNSGVTAQLTVPSGQLAGSYKGTLQYTITG